MKLREVRKIIKKIVKDCMPDLNNNEYHYILTEFADKTYELEFRHSFDKGAIIIDTIFLKEINQRVVRLIVINKEEEIIFEKNLNIRLGKEITK